jgi:hypothetical protein
MAVGLSIFVFSVIADVSEVTEIEEISKFFYQNLIRSEILFGPAAKCATISQRRGSS